MGELSCMTNTRRYFCPYFFASFEVNQGYIGKALRQYRWQANIL